MATPLTSKLGSGLGDALVARLVLLANHVIASEPAAVVRLKPHAGRCIDLALSSASRGPLLGAFSTWLPPKVGLLITPAGLLEAAAPLVDDSAGPIAGLTVTVEVPDPFSALRMALRRERPAVRIEGDAALAETVSWLMKNLRWDIEDDLARWLGAPPTQILKTIANGVRQALARWRPGSSATQPGHGR